MHLRLPPSIKLGLTASVLLGCLQSGPTLGAPLSARLAKVQENIETFGLSPLAPGPRVDVYHLLLDNPNPFAPRFLDLSLSVPRGNLLNLGPEFLTFSTAITLPVIGALPFAESFLVLPTDPIFDPLAFNVVDNSTTLSARYPVVTPSGVELVPANSTGAVIAILSVPTGTGLSFASSQLGAASVNGQLEAIILVPEPTTALLAACGITAASGRRQRKGRPQRPYPPTGLPN